MIVKECHDGVGGFQADDVRGVGDGGQGESPEGASGGRGGKGEGYHEQHVGKVWRFEEGGDRNGGLGADSSEENLGKEDIDRSRSGGIDGSEDSRILLEGCGRIVGTEDCRVVAIEDCRTGGSHMDLLLMTIVDVRRMYDS